MQNKDIIEVLIHSSSKPLTQKSLNYALEGKKVNLDHIVKDINQEYKKANKGYRIEKISSGYQLLSKSEFHYFIERLNKEDKKPRFSKAAMESLSIVAYKQPITRNEVDHIRGVDSSGVMKNLLEKGLVTIRGRDEGLGRALLYATTPLFLELFGLNSLKDLPTLEELTQIMDETTQSTSLDINENK
tara:strand:- start:376 stop:936 length:561 start_codon:yes stop_codon:yes gene_type:complete